MSYPSNSNTDINSELFANLVTDAQFAAYENSIARQLVTVFDAPVNAGKILQVPIWAAITADVITDESDATAKTTNTSSATITLAEHVVYHQVTDMLRDSSFTNVMTQLGDQSGRAIAQSLDNQVFGLFDDLSGNTAIITQSVGTAGSDNTVAHLLAAAATLRGNKLTGPFFAVLHPKQAYGIKANLTATTSYTATSNVGNRVLDMFYIGEIAGIQVFESALVPVDGSDDATGCVFAPTAFGHAMRGALEMETQRQASARATDVVLRAVAGASILQPTHAVRVIGDALIN
jgi:N4-gp56 family major capsid protein